MRQERERHRLHVRDRLGQSSPPQLQGEPLLWRGDAHSLGGEDNLRQWFYLDATRPAAPFYFEIPFTIYDQLSHSRRAVAI